MTAAAQETKPQATAQATVEAKSEEKKQEQTPQLSEMTAERLRDLYAKSPQMFEEAGISKKAEEKKPEEKPEEKPKPEEKSAAPSYEGTAIQIPKDVEVNVDAVGRYLSHAKEIGLSPKQVQAELDFQVKLAREAAAAQKSRETLAKEQDAANVAKLRSDKEFGAAFDANMELARRAAVKFGDPELLERLRTSDPVLVRHLWKLGKADAEDSTKSAPNRSGEEGAKEQDEITAAKLRYNNSPQMFKDN